MDREYRVISALRPRGFPVAEPVLYCADVEVVGTAFYVMAYVDGRVFWEPSMPHSHASERARVYDTMNATLARLHGFDPLEIGLNDFGKGRTMWRGRSSVGPSSTGLRKPTALKKWSS